MRPVDLFYTYKFLRLLSMKWEDTDAYKLGIIDKDGKPLKKSKDLTTSEEKNAYTSFIRLVFKIKRLLSKLPGGNSFVGRYGAALALIKENREELEKMKVSIETLTEIFEKKKKALNEEPVNTTTGMAIPESPMKKKKCLKRKKNIKNKKEKVMEFLVFDDFALCSPAVAIDEMRKVRKVRIVNGKRVRGIEYTGSSRYNRRGNKKLRGSAKTKFKRSHRKMYRKAHSAAAKRKRARSMRKRRNIH